MKKTKSMPTPQPATISGEQLAGLCNLTKRRLYQLAEEQKIPPAENGNFPMLTTIRRLFEFYQRDGETLQREKMLKTTAERKLREHELAKIQGKYLPKEDVVRAAAGIGLKIRAVLTRKLCHDFPISVEQAAPQELKALARTTVHDIGQSAAADALEHLKCELLAIK